MRNAAGVFLFLMVVGICFFSGCGRKTPLRLPDEAVPTPMRMFRHEIQEDRVILSWAMDTARFRDPVEEIRLYRAMIPLSSYCRGCPLPFHPLARLGGDTTVYEEVLVPGHHYAFQIQTVDAKNNLSPKKTVEFSWP